MSTPHLHLARIHHHRWQVGHPRRSHQPLNQRKHYMAVEFETSKEIIGGSWYVEGKLDVEFIKLVKDLCLKHIDKLEVVTMEGLFDYFRRSGILKVELSSHQIFKMLRALILDNEIEEVKSTGKGENLWGSSVTVA